MTPRRREAKAQIDGAKRRRKERFRDAPAAQIDGAKERFGGSEAAERFGGMIRRRREAALPNKIRQERRPRRTDARAIHGRAGSPYRRYS